ncbi:MAG: DUF368 domain-containing protein [Anaerolineae bacterium]
MVTHLLVFLKGVVYGSSYTIPGVCSGVVLIMLGAYEEFVEAIGNLFCRRNWRSYVTFLAPLGAGSVVGLVISATLVTWLLQNYRVPTMLGFAGLLVGTIPSLLRLHDDMRPTVGRGVALLASLGLVVLISVVQRQSGQAGEAVDPGSLKGIFFTLITSFFAGGAGVAPGVLGTFFLLLAGTYEPIVGALSALGRLVVRWETLAPTGIGALLGAAIFAKLIDTALKRAPSLTYYSIVGLVAGSLYGLWPQEWLSVNPLALVLPFGAGLAVPMLIAKRCQGHCR